MRRRGKGDVLDFRTITLGQVFVSSQKGRLEKTVMQGVSRSHDYFLSSSITIAYIQLLILSREDNNSRFEFSGLPIRNDQPVDFSYQVSCPTTLL
jgi:hypothetical protein